MSYSFRIRFAQSPRYSIETQENKLILPVPDKQISVALCSKPEDISIREASKLVIKGTGYNSFSAAEIDGQRIKNALIVAFARWRIGVDFWQTMTAKTILTEEGLKQLEQETGKRVLHDVEGLMVFESNPKPTLAYLEAEDISKWCISHPPEDILQDFSKALESAPSLSERETLAFRLYNSSLFQLFFDARFLLLIMAIETLSEYAPRSEKAIAHVDMLIESTKSCRNLRKEDSNSMIGALRWLKQESIRQAGKRLVTERLGDRMYADMNAVKYFSQCYDLRSKLVHGGTPNRKKIEKLVPQLPLFVSDLLTTPILGPSDTDKTN
ncbi:MAG: hypothetical protein Q3M24_03650 [Candidatus Electrothrix aestuarii]|uniref:Apea-like HEPN domain-containing protein n=1 Tax=Candidatus Electrothrix aestuarii TaxID=3062594 RepID=A0AAU8LYB8_9BACT|nr:HEPN domain-containing protein [Candidatus Electrothrix aestuarii]